MPYRATNDVVQRVMPLIDRLARRSIDKARLLQYLSANAGLDWGIYELVSDREVEMETGAGVALVRELTVRDRGNGDTHTLRYPDSLAALPPEIEPMILTEYKRLAVARPLGMMAESLFTYFFKDEFCDRCKWQGREHTQVQTECRFAGNPVNFEPVETITS